MTFENAYRHAAGRLAGAGISDARTDAWLLLEYATGISREKYFLGPDLSVSDGELESYLRLVDLRSSRIPLQYITGSQVFMGMEFAVGPGALIPRQDTEILVESVLEILRTGMDVLDMCAGSGCVLLSLLKLCDGVKGIGADISDGALSIARMNARRLGVEATFVKSDLFSDISGTFDIIVSNPPYIPTGDIGGLDEEVRLHEPRVALDGGADGLEFYRRIVPEGRKYLKRGGSLFLEIGCGQAESVVTLMKEAGFAPIAVRKDLSGLDRVVCGIYGETAE